LVVGLGRVILENPPQWNGRMMTHKIIFLLLSFLASYGSALAQMSANSCWYSNSNGFAEHANCIESRAKDLRIGKAHLDHLHFADGLAAVFSKDYGWMYVNRTGAVIVSGVSSVDNGPDAFRDGFVRYEKNGKCGYATSRGDGAITPRFDGCMPFDKGKARVCTGCRREPVDANGEYHELRGGEWFCIDSKGKRVVCN